MGVREHKHAAPHRLACAIVTVSDTRVPESDVAGALIRERLVRSGHEVAFYRIVPDEQASIVSVLEGLARDGAMDAVIMTGGTGLAPRDVTYEAVARVLQKTMDGFGELFRMLSYEQIGSAAMLSRALAGVVGSMLVFALPGSPAACELALDELILPELGHAVAIANPRRREH